MKQNKQIRAITLLLTFALLFLLTACEKKENIANDTQQSHTETSQKTDTHKTEYVDQSSKTEASTNTEISDTFSTDTQTPSSQNPTDGGAVTDTSTSSGATSSKTEQQTGPQDTDNTPNPEPPPKSDPPAITALTPISPANYYGRTWLQKQSNGKALVRAYDKIVQGVSSLSQTISLEDSSYPVSGDELLQIWNCYRSDYPQHFWLGLKYDYTYNGTQVLDLKPQYTLSLAQKETAVTKFEDAAKTLLEGLSGSMSQYELEKAIHDRLILACTYSKQSSFCHTAYGALVDKNAVCDGFSMAFQYLCRMAGIQTLLVQGSSLSPITGSSEGHAWNIVYIDGKPYHVDATWDNAGEPTEDRMHYGYFNLTTAQISVDHTIAQEESYTLPNCSATEENFFVKTKTLYRELTVDQVISSSKKTGNTVFCRFRLEGTPNLEAWINENIETLVLRLGLSGSISFSYTTLGREVCFILTQQ